MKNIILICFLVFLSSCANKTYYIADWQEMPVEFNYPRISNVWIAEKDLSFYLNNKSVGPIRGPYIKNWRGGIIKLPNFH